MRTSNLSSSSAIVAMMFRFWSFPFASAVFDRLELVGCSALPSTGSALGPRSLESALKPIVNGQRLNMKSDRMKTKLAFETKRRRNLEGRNVC
jgi:hypothetical protein